MAEMVFSAQRIDITDGSLWCQKCFSGEKLDLVEKIKWFLERKMKKERQESPEKKVLGQGGWIICCVNYFRKKIKSNKNFETRENIPS